MRFFVFGVLLLFVKTVAATHIVGGELNYQYLGNDQYHVTLKLYRDCNPNVSGQYPANVHLAIYTADGNLYQQIEMPLPAIDTVPNNANSPCLQILPDVCVQIGVYEGDVTLPPQSGGYNLVCSFCCRNLTILNVTTSGNNVGATYFSTIPDTSIGYNSEPYFNVYPPTALCAGYPFSFDHSATDPDGDSLAYALCVLYDNSGGSTQPNPPSPPPFPTIGNYNSPYSYLNPLDGNPPLSIDPVTGLMNVTPTAIGQFLVGVCVKEFRSGVLLGEHRRDFQFNVTDCALCPAITGIPLMCDQDTTQLFVNGSPNVIWFPNNDISDINATNPFFYPDSTTTYFVVYDTSNACHDTASFTITVVDDAIADAGSDTTIIDGQSVTLAATGGVSFQWITEGMVISQNDTNIVTPTQTTTYYLVAFVGSCTDVDTVVVNVIPNDITDPSSGDFRIYPNPFTDVLYLDLSSYSNDVKLIEIMLTDGRIIYKQSNLDNSTQVLSFADYPCGTYWMRLLTHQGVSVHSIVKLP